MKKLFILLSFTFLNLVTNLILGSTLTADCIEDVVLSTQDEVNSYPISNGCAELEGNLWILDIGNIDNLDALSEITSIAGDLWIGNPTLTDISGLSNLTSIGGNLTLNNNGFDNLTGLNNLVWVGEDVWVAYNNTLTDLEGLNNLESIGGNLTIYQNPLLSDLGALQNTNAIQGNVLVSENPALEECCLFLDLSNTTTGAITLENNATGCNSLAEMTAICLSIPCLGDFVLSSQADIDNFANDFDCTEIGGSLRIEGDDISNLDGLSNLTTIGDYLIIHNNPLLNSLSGLENLTTVGSYMSIFQNDALPNIDALNGLTSVGWNIGINQNDLLENLNGLSNLTSIGGYFRMFNNDALTSIEGLSNINSIGGYLEINDNNALAICCTYIDLSSVIEGNIYITNNAEGCNAVSDIYDNCLNSTISGYLYQDINENCVFDSDEIPYINQVVQLISQTNNNVYYALTDSSGRYEFRTMAGDYTIISNFATNNPYELWSAICPSNEIDTTIADNENLENQNFAYTANLNCSVLKVDLGVHSLTPCSAQTVFLSYSNIGNVLASDAYIEINLDEDIVLDSASSPFSNIGDNVYQFVIGDLAAFESGTINLYTTVICEATLGKTAQIEAHIYPDDFCGTPDASWDGSDIEVGAICEGDSIKYYITNTGDDMSAARGYTVYEDDLLLEVNDYDLDGGDSLIFARLANGTTFRLEAEQSEYFPGFSNPKAIVEMCSDGSFDVSSGFVGTTSPNDLDPFVDILLVEITEETSPINAFDQTILPSGVSAMHWVETGTILEYSISFQNTNPETISELYILDTISEYLDLSTFESATSSHNYSVTLLEDRTIRWDFANINLPSSDTNLLGSNGFVKFKINVLEDAQEQTTIFNKADIFLDNSQLANQTSTVFVSICNNCIDNNFTSTNALKPVELNQLNIYPNPNKGRFIIDLEQTGFNANFSIFSKPLLKIYNVTGQLILEQQIDYNGTQNLIDIDLNSGIYILSIESDKEIKTTKLIIQP